MTKITRTVKSIIYAVLCYNNGSGEVENLHVNTTKKFRTDKALENFLRTAVPDGYTFIRCVESSEDTVKYSMDLDKFIENAVVVEDED